MAKQFPCLTDPLIKFIEQQKMFFVGTAAEDGRVNVSPKGGDSLRVLDESRIAWLNLTGSGNETAAHVGRVNRMTIMFCAFEGKPLILRTYGKAAVLHQDSFDWEDYAALFPNFTGSRQIFIQHIDLVQSSCGMSVPNYSFESDRQLLNDWADKKGAEGIQEYWLTRNQSSIDGFETHISDHVSKD